MAKQRLKIGIRREDKNQWEGRVPLIPADVRTLIDEHHLSITLQPSNIRAFADEEFTKAGAVINEDISDRDVVLAVKEIPIPFFNEGKTYLFFSHTIKGQKENMPLLKAMMEKKCTLIDYEKITDHVSRRLIFFGRYAGLVGMINTFWTLGRRLAQEGFDTPFALIKQAVDYKNLEEAKQAVLQLSAAIIQKGLPREIGPIVFGFAGYGNVSRGAQEVFDLLPFKRVLPEELAALHENPDYTTNILYKAIFKEEDLVRPSRPGRVFVLQHYYDQPEQYQSKFESYLPYLTVLVNAIYWDKRYPRLVTLDYLKKAQKEKTLRLKVVGDITCDTGGSIQCNLRSTDSGSPVYVYDPQTGQAIDGVKGQGPVILATDNLPCELGRESSEAFSSILVKFIPDIVSADLDGSLEESGLPDEIKRAVVLWKGQLTPEFEYLKTHLDATN